MIQNLSDIQLIDSVKNNNDSTALSTLIDKVTGLYVSTVTGYSYVPHFERQELLDNKTYNIYSFIKDYDAERGMSFTTYIAQRTKWKCQSLLFKHPEPEELNESLIDNNDTLSEIERHDIYNNIIEYAEDIDDPRFFEIFKIRHLSGDKKNWIEIGQMFNLSNEGARKIYKRNIKKIKNKILKCK